MRIATPIAAPMNSAPRKNGENSSITAMPIMVSQIAGRQSRQSPLIGHPFIVHPLWRSYLAPTVSSAARCFWTDATARKASFR